MINPADVNRYQQDAYNNPEVVKPYGQSVVDQKLGQKTSAYMHKQYATRHLDSHGNEIAADTHNYGTDTKGFLAGNQRLLTGNSPVTNPVVSPQPVAPTGQGFSAGVGNHEMKPNPGFPVAGQKREQKANWYAGNKKSTGDIRSDMAYGGPIPLADSNDLQVDGPYKYVCDNAIELQGASHAAGGQRIAANGTEVEAEGKEIVAQSADGSKQVLGNLYMSGTNQKHKDIMRKIERKSGKAKSQASYLLNNYEANDKYQAPTFNTGRVLADAHEQYKTAGQAIIDDNNLQLEMADHYGVKPVSITNDLKGKAKYGKKLPKAQDGHNDTAYAQVYNPDTKQMEFVPDTKGYIEPHDDYSDPNLKNRRGIGAQRLGYTDPSNGGKPNTTGTSARYNKSSKTSYDKRTHKPALKTDAAGYPDWSLDMAGIPVKPGGVYSPEDLSPRPLNSLPTSNTQIPTSVDEAQPIAQRTDAPNLPAVLSSEELDKRHPEDVAAKDKKKVKGLRNKFRIGDYLGEIAGALDQERNYAMPQRNPVLEQEYSLSFQNEKNDIISTHNAAMKNTANNPAAQAAIAGQMAEQLAQVDAKETQFNEQNKGQIRGRNLQEIRRVGDINYQGDMQDLQQRAATHAAHEDIVRGAATSFGYKEAQRRAGNRTLQMEEQGYGWVMGPDGKYQMIKPGYEFTPEPVYIQNPDTETKKTTTKKKGPKGEEDTQKRSTTEVPWQWVE